MAPLAWLLIAVGLSSPLLATYLAAAEMRAAGYASGTGYLVSIGAIIWVIVQTRSMALERRGRAYLIAAAIVVTVNLWSSFKIMQGAGIDREIAAARPQINRIMQLAATEVTLINSGQIAPADVSPGWQPYTTAPAIELGDATVPLRVRFTELMRRAKSRELELVRKAREEVDASGIATALSPERLASAQDRADSLARIERYRAFMKSYASRLADLGEQAQQDIHALGMPRASEDEMIGGRARSIRENATAFDQYIEQELQAIDSVQGVIRLVDAHGEFARVKDGKLMLSDSAAQAEYEAMLSRLGLTDG